MPKFVIFLFGILVSIVPIIELKGAVPFVMSGSIWGANSLPFYLAFLSAIVGGAIASIVSATVFVKCKKYFLKIKILNKIFTNTQKTLQKYVLKSSKTPKRKWWIVFAFCALPIPGSGVWSAGILGSLLNLKYFDTILALILGNLVTALVVMVFCYWLKEFVDIILVVLGIILTLFAIYKILSLILNKIQDIKLKKCAKKD